MMNFKTLTAGLLTTTFAVAAVDAASLNYGDFVSTNVTFEQVTESSSSPLPLLGAPTTADDALIFTPITFGAEANNGVPSSDIVDAQLRTQVTSNAGIGIDTITINEAGDYTLIGVPGAFALASVSAPVFIDIIEVDGVAVDGPELITDLFIAPGSGVYDLGTDGLSIGVVWTGNLTVDIAQLAADNGITGNVTGVDITFDNTLSAASGAGASAIIKKKQAEIEVTLVPEPASAALLALGLAGLARRRG
ncbi:PEP-CTERM sorting domain-containing protein [Mucisphaera sp.]|uniref:PEP-CTERM sorting domain-containing protein n=1 Tax=Mucisphaera sp. TaxID=2913024 RepID=UPI003D122F70